MTACDNTNAADRAALERMSVSELEDLLSRMYDSPEHTDADSERMLEILEILESRSDNGDYIRLDAVDALASFRETFLPSAEQETPAEIPASEQPGNRHGRPRASLPAFIAAFTAGRQLSQQEIDEVQRMIDDFRKEL